MKGIQGLIIAIGLGIAGALFNFAYLYSKSRDVEKVAFIGIDPKVTVARGDRLTKEHLVPVEIPRNNVGNLEEVAVRYSALQTVIGQNVWRTLAGGSLVLRDDLKTPPPELNFGRGPEASQVERAMFVPIDMRKMVPSLVVPGDQVTFVTPSFAAETPTLADEDPGRGESGAGTGPAKTELGKTDREPLKPVPARTTQSRNSRRLAAEPGELIGPFKVLSLGNRLGSAEVMKASKIPQTQESVMTILVKVDKDKEGKEKLAGESAKLVQVLDAVNWKPIVYLLHPRLERSP